MSFAREVSLEPSGPSRSSTAALDSNAKHCYQYFGQPMAAGISHWLNYTVTQSDASASAGSASVRAGVLGYSLASNSRAAAEGREGQRVQRIVILWQSISSPTIPARIVIGDGVPELK